MENKQGSEPGDGGQQRFEWLLSEQAFVNQRLGSYSELEQKIVGVMATVVVAIIGLSFSKAGGIEEEHIPYILFLASGLLSLAALQSAIYSALAVLFMERKIGLSQRIADTVGKDGDFALTGHSLFDLKFNRSYTYGVFGYYAFKCLAGPVLVASGFRQIQYNDSASFRWAFWTTSIFALVSVGVTVFHLIEFARFKKAVLKDEVKAKGTVPESPVPHS